MMVLVGLIFIVVGFNVFHSLRRSVHERTEEIALLKAAGVPPRHIQAIFVTEGFMVGLVGAVAGLIAGLGISINVSGVFSLVEALVNAVLRLLQLLASLFMQGEARRRSPFFLPRISTSRRFPPGVSPGGFFCVLLRRARVHGGRMG